MGISKLEEFWPWLWDLDLRTQAMELVWGTFSLSLSLSLTQAVGHYVKSYTRMVKGIMLRLSLVQTSTFFSFLEVLPRLTPKSCKGMPGCLRSVSPT